MSTWKWIKHGWKDNWRYTDAWHRLWPFRPLMCWTGRHDYFARHLTEGGRDERNGVMLMCFYCEHRKHQITVASKAGEDL